jgi:hypothetical protein
VRPSPPCGPPAGQKRGRLTPGGSARPMVVAGSARRYRRSAKQKAALVADFQQATLRCPNFNGCLVVRHSHVAL